MRVTTFFAVLGVCLFLFVIGCSNETAVEQNPTMSNLPGQTVDTAATRTRARGGLKIDCDTSCVPGDEMEANEVTGTATLELWLSLGSSSEYSSYCFIVYKSDKTGGSKDPVFCAGTSSLVNFDDGSCFPGNDNSDLAYQLEDDLPALPGLAAGQYKGVLYKNNCASLSLCTPNGHSIGSDSFQVSSSGCS